MRSSMVLIRGGLGNQMFQVACGLVLAQRYGVAVRHVDFSTDARVGREWGLSVFGVEREVIGPARWLALRYAVMAGRRLQRTLGWQRPLGMWLEPLDGSVAQWPERAPWLADGYWQKAEFYLRHQEALRQRFRVELGARASQVDALRAQGRPLVAMHARRGDYVSDPAAAMHLVCDVGYYRRGWEQLQQRLNQPQLLVFSDDPDWARVHLSFAPDTQFAQAEPGQPAWVDMMCMSRSDHFVISNSSYSWWAAFLANSPGKQVVAPDHWLVGQPTAPLGVCPPDWQLI